VRRDEILARARAELARAPHAFVEYAELRDPESLEPAPERLRGPSLLALAVRFPAGDGATVRLIDNRVLHPSPSDRGLAGSADREDPR
jgi:pantothenate synthetase